MNLYFFIMPITCGLIGYFTNWLAIKMLFRPYESKKIFNITLPFTPGILPKRKNALAKQVGRSVSNHLLTKDMIKDAIIKDTLNTLVDNIYNKLIEDSKTIDTYIYQLLGDNKDNIVEKCETYITNLLYNYLNNEEFKLQFSLLLKDKVIKILEEVDIYSYIINNKDSLISEIFNIIEERIEHLKKDEILIKEIIPESYVSKIKKLIIDNNPKFFSYIQNELETNRNIDNILKKIVKQICEENLGRIVGSVFYKKVYESIKLNLITYLNKEDNRKVMVDKACYMIDILLAKDINYLIDMALYTETNKSSIQKNKFKHIIYNFISERLELNMDISLIKIIKKINPNYDELIYQFIYKNITNILNKEGTEVINKCVKEIKNYILNINISEKLKEVSNKDIRLIKNYIINKGNYILEECSSYFINKIDINKLVENKVNDFKSTELEALILDVTRKELNYITLMGGILGFILGLIVEIIMMI